jgi:hypothetical protein
MWHERGLEAAATGMGTPAASHARALQWPEGLGGDVAASGLGRRCARGGDGVVNRGNYWLRRMHECVFGVLALESEPVDPRL